MTSDLDVQKEYLKLLAAGLSQAEAELILAKRNQPPPPPKPSRISKAAEVMAKAQKRVGVDPVVVDGDSLEKVYDPDADVGLQAFYKKEVSGTEPRIRPSVIQGRWVEAEDESQDPKDYR